MSCPICAQIGLPCGDASSQSMDGVSNGKEKPDCGPSLSQAPDWLVMRVSHHLEADGLGRYLIGDRREFAP